MTTSCSLAKTIQENRVSFMLFLQQLEPVSEKLEEKTSFIASNETEAPKAKEVLIDLLFKPIDTDGKVVDKFPGSSPWLLLWGNGIANR